MKIEKRKIGTLDKCYALAALTYEGRECFLVASEKEDACRVYSREGKLLDTVWTSPGGVMSMEQLPERDGRFLSVQKFYSPNDAADAMIVLASPLPGGGWEVRTLCKAPYAHRIGILERGGARYLLVCCLKTGCEFEDDWRYPGVCYGAELPGDLSAFDEEHPLPLTPVRSGMLRNHGFSKLRRDGYDAGLVGSEEGTFLFEPPAAPGEDWTVTQLSSVPSSDSVLADFDGDGLPELGCISPFHGSSLTVYHRDLFGNYVPRWKYPCPERETEMLHATWCCELGGKPAWIVGWRKGTRDTVLIRWDEEAGTYRTDFIDRNAGCANALHFKNASGEDVIVGANREIDEIALYTVTE